MRLKKSLLAVLFVTLACVGVARAQDPDPKYDRLDGRGASGKKVDVIEWEGNLEIHVYPKGSLRGLALKLDKTNKSKPVMIIGYRFDTAPQTQLVRRAIMGIPIEEGFKAYKDPMESDFDKIIISNQGLSSQVVAFKLDPEPKQLYPEGHPANAVAENGSPGNPRTARKPAESREEAPESRPDEDGRIKPFFINDEARGGRGAR